MRASDVTRARRPRGDPVRPARSTRRICCSCPASAIPSCLPRTASRRCTTLPGVGENLQDHLQLRLIFGIEGLPTLNITANSLIGKAGMALQYALLRRGPMTMAPSQMGGFARSSAEYETPNVEFHVQPLSLDKFGEPLHRFPAFTATRLQSEAARAAAMSG